VRVLVSTDRRGWNQSAVGLRPRLVAAQFFYDNGVFPGVLVLAYEIAAFGSERSRPTC